MEFAIVIPVLLLILTCLLDLGYYIYVRSILSGEVQAAGRASGMETATQANRDRIDAHVQSAVRGLVRNAQVRFDRIAYKSYARAQAKAESYTDLDHDGRCDHGEPFDDANANGMRDLDSGIGGQGGAKDVTLYTVTVQYRRLFPVTLPILGTDATVSARTILRNQPYDKQAEPVIGHCP